MPTGDVQAARRAKTARERRRAVLLGQLRPEALPVPRYPIFVLSKGRAGIARTVPLLQQHGVACTLVVEPGDVPAYRDAYPAVPQIVLPFSDRGLGRARQYLLDVLRHQDRSWYWQLDDNLTGFCQIRETFTFACTPQRALGQVEARLALAPNIALAGPDYVQFAAHADAAWTWNTRVYCCILQRTDTGLDWEGYTRYGFKADVAYCLRHLQAGWRTILCHDVAMEKPTLGSGSTGGQVPGYRAGVDREAARLLHAEFPDVTRLVQKHGRIDVRVDWARFAEPASVPEETSV